MYRSYVVNNLLRSEAGLPFNQSLVRAMLS